MYIKIKWINGSYPETAPAVQEPIDSIESSSNDNSSFDRYHSYKYGYRYMARAMHFPSNKLYKCSYSVWFYNEIIDKYSQIRM